MSKYAFTLAPSTHAALSASGTSRWMACAASPRLSEGIPGSTTLYAAQGTAAHYIAAKCQQDGKGPERWLGQTASVEGHDVDIDDVMVQAVADFLAHIYSTEKKGDLPYIEHDITTALRKLHPKLGGHADRIMWRPDEKLLRVYDFKYGAGVYVDVVDNKQVKTYALGALLTFEHYHAEKVQIVIAQPRMDSEQGRFRTHEFAAIDLLDFSSDLIDAVKATENPASVPVPGEKQCRFCPAASVPGRCPALEAKHTELMASQFSDLTKGYDLNKLSAALSTLPLLEARIEAVRQFAYGEAEKGVAIPGWKLVEKMARRKWKSVEAVQAKLLHRPDYYTQPALKPPAQIEKIIGKKEFARVLADEVEKVSSGHTLAPEADPRPAIKLLTADSFENLESV